MTRSRTRSTATNNGQLTLHDVTVTDPMTGLSAIGCTPAPRRRSPAATSMTCTATYTVTQADVDAGSIVNTATVDGLDPADNPVTDSDGATVQADQVESLAFTKTASPSGAVSVGDVITYTMIATNDGTVTVDNTVITDPMPGLSPLDCTPAKGASLAPGDAMTCTATYTVTDADIARGSDRQHRHRARATASTVTRRPTPARRSCRRRTTPTSHWSSSSTTSRATPPRGGSRSPIRGAGPLPGPFTVTDQLPSGLTYVSATGTGWTCTGTETISCTHAAALAAGADTSITVVTTMTGTGTITNIASMDVLGKTVSSDAVLTPTESGRAASPSPGPRSPATASSVCCWWSVVGSCMARPQAQGRSTS